VLAGAEGQAGQAGENQELTRLKVFLAVLSPKRRATDGLDRGRKPRKVRRPTREPRRELCNFVVAPGRPLFERLNPLARFSVDHCSHKRSQVI
jgi:hypothetical protein